MTSLSSLLVRDQIVGVRRIEEALQRQVVHGGDLETNLLELGAVSEDALAQYRAQIEGLGSVAAAEVMHPDADAVALLTPELVERHRMIPLRVEGTRILVAVASPPPPGTLDELSFLLSLDFVPRITTELRIAAALAHVFGIPMAPRFARLAEKLGPVPFGGVARAHVVTVSSREPANKADDRVIALVGGKRPSERATPAPEPKLVVEPWRPSREEETERGLVVEPAAPLRDKRTVLGIAPVSGPEIESAGPLREDTTDRGIAPVSGPEVGIAAEPARPSWEQEPRPTAVDEPRFVVEPTAPPRDEETERVFTPVPRVDPAPRRRRKMGPTVAAELLEAAATRDEVLEILLEVAHQTLAYVAVFVVGEGSADGRAAIGAGATTERLRAISIPLDRPSFIRTVKESRSHFLGPIHDEDSNHAILRDLGRAPPANAVVLPIVLRSRVVLLIYGDNGRRPTTGEDIIDLLALAPKVTAAFQRLILARKFTGYSPGEPDPRSKPPRSERVPKRPSPAAPTAASMSEIVSKRPAVEIGPSDAPPIAPRAVDREQPSPPMTPLPLRPERLTMKVAVAPDPGDRIAPAHETRADTLLGIPAVGLPDEGAGPGETVQMSVPPEATAEGGTPEATAEGGTPEATAEGGTPEARTAETAPLATDECTPASSAFSAGSADAADVATTIPSPAPVMTVARVQAESAVAETAPLPVESAVRAVVLEAAASPTSLADRLRDAAEAMALAQPADEPVATTSSVAPSIQPTEGAGPDAGAGTPASGASPVEGARTEAAGSTVPPSEVDTGPLAQSQAGATMPPLEVETAPLPTAATERSGAAPGEAGAAIPRTSEIPTGEEGDEDEPELTISPWNVGDRREAFTPPPRVADTMGEDGLDASMRPTDPAPPEDDRLRQPPELGPISGSSAGRRRVHHDAFRVDVLTPLPVPEQPIPSVIVDMGPNIESLVDSVLRGGEEGDLAAAALQKIGEGAIPALVQRFPGPLAFDRHSPHTRLPRVGECGPILRLLPGFRQHAVPYLLPLLSSASPEIRFYATFLFSELQYPEAIPSLAPLLWDADQQTRILAIDVLKGFRRFPEFTDLTRELRKTAWDASVPSARRRVAVEAIGELRDAGAVALLIELLGHEDPQLSELCWRSLVLITRQDFGQAKKKWQHWLQKEGSRHHVEWLIDALVHPSPELRLGASEELKRLTKEYFGYYYNLPRRDREKARKRYLEWWDRIGRARFTGQRT